MTELLDELFTNREEFVSYFKEHDCAELRQRWLKTDKLRYWYVRFVSNRSEVANLIASDIYKFLTCYWVDWDAFVSTDFKNSVWWRGLIFNKLNATKDHPLKEGPILTFIWRGNFTDLQKLGDIHMDNENAWAL